MPKTKVPVKVAHRSGFDKSHVHQGTSLVGVLTPVMLDEVIPNSKIRLKIDLGASLPPLAADTFMKCDIAVEAFFCPHRLCYGGFESWFSQRKDAYLEDDAISRYTPYMPEVQLDFAGDSDGIRKYFGHRGLPDYLGWSNSGNLSAGGTIFNLNPLPFIAYHLIWQHFYRQPLVQNECFVRPSVKSNYNILETSGVGIVASLPYLSLGELQYVLSASSYEGQMDFFSLADGVNLFQLRKRNFDYDYFTNAYPSPTLGDDVEVHTTDLRFTIASLRAANAIADFQQKNQIAGTRYNDTLKARYGATLSDGVAQRPVCLGAARYNVYNRSMVVSGTNPSDNYTNPFNKVAGGVQGNAYASGSDLIIDDFTANEPGYIMVIMSLVPTVTYSTALDRIFTRYCLSYNSESSEVGPAGQLGDMAVADLQGVGNQPIYQYELHGKPTTTVGGRYKIFGYTDRFADWMVKHDRISGLFRSGLSLSAFVSQRYFRDSDDVVLGTNFLEIPTDYLDNVTAVSGDASQYGYWFECKFNYFVSQPLYEYSIPSLINPAYEHGDTVMIHRGGFRF